MKNPDEPIIKQITLLPCPFCGGAASEDLPFSRHRPICVGCSECEVWFKDMDWETVVAEWNRRAPIHQETNNG